VIEDPPAVSPDADPSSAVRKQASMTIQEQRSVTTDVPVETESGGLTNRTTTSRKVGYQVDNNETARRIVVLVFGLIQIVIGLRIVLLLLDARAGNLIVSIINNVGGILVAPFQGILNISAVSSGGSVLDVAAVVALIGWTIVELVVIWSLRIFRREPALA
jgi:hypothetical protein